MEELKQLLRAKLDDHDLLIEMRTVQSGMAAEMRTLAAGITATVADHERRLRAVEQRQVYWLGGLGVITLLGGVLFKVFGGKFGL